MRGELLATKKGGGQREDFFVSSLSPFAFVTPLPSIAPLFSTEPILLILLLPPTLHTPTSPPLSLGNSC